MTPDDIRFGDRSRFYKLQPFAIALLSCRGRDFFYFNTHSRPADGLVVFQRRATSSGQPQQIALIALNFSDQERTLTLPAPVAGTYREMLDRLNRGGELDVAVGNANDPLTLSVLSNYGRVFVTPPPAPGV